MRRYLALILALIFLLPCLIVPASATMLTGDYDALISSNVYNIYSRLQQFETNFSSFWAQWSAFFTDGQWLTDLSGLLAGFGEAFISPVSDLLGEIDAYFLEDTELFVYWDRDGDGEAEIDYVTGFEDDLIALFVYCRDVLFGEGWEFYDYFFVEDDTAIRYSYYNTNSGIGMRPETITGLTGFQADLTTLGGDVIYGVYNGFYRIVAILSTASSYLKTISSNVSSILSGDSETSSAVQDEVSQDVTEASEYLDIMDDVTKPDESELEDLSDISGYVDAGDVSTFSAVFAPLFQSAVFLPVIMLNLTFMLIAYVLFGKR